MPSKRNQAPIDRSLNSPERRRPLHGQSALDLLELGLVVRQRLLGVGDGLDGAVLGHRGDAGVHQAGAVLPTHGQIRKRDIDLEILKGALW